MPIHGNASQTGCIYRQILKAMSHPGRIHRLPTGGFWPSGLLAIADTLFDHEISFAVVGEAASQRVADKIAASTMACRAASDEADYLIVLGPNSNGAVRGAKRGQPEHPDQSATLIYGIQNVGSSHTDGVTLTGPGIPGSISPQMGGLDVSELAEIRAVNSEYPLGVDCIFINETDHVLCIPRSVKITITGV
jgi:alpha-D-ribose 1-methylphosphonate 5-triphosphate synthase subunit PhnH